MKPKNIGKKDDFECFDSVSATDCTGLISSAPENDYEYESYFDVMTFSPKDFHSADNARTPVTSK